MRPTLVKLPKAQQVPLWRRSVHCLLFFLTVAVAIGTAAFVWSCQRHESVSGDQVEVSLGCIPDNNNEEGQRSALRVLSSELRKHPAANTFLIRWRSAWLFPEQQLDEWVLAYDRQRRQVHYGTCCDEGWDPVTEQMIHAVAGHRGLLSEFEKYGAQPGP